MKEKKTVKEMLLELNWNFKTRKEANDYAFRFALAYPEYGFYILESGSEFFVAFRDNDSKSGNFVNR